MPFGGSISLRAQAGVCRSASEVCCMNALFGSKWYNVLAALGPRLVGGTCPSDSSGRARSEYRRQLTPKRPRQRLASEQSIPTDKTSLRAPREPILRQQTSRQRQPRRRQSDFRSISSHVTSRLTCVTRKPFVGAHLTFRCLHHQTRCHSSHRQLPSCGIKQNVSKLHRNISYGLGETNPTASGHKHSKLDKF